MKQRILSGILAAALLLACAGCGKKAQDTASEEQEQATNVTAVAAARQSIVNKIANNGEVKPCEEVVVSPKVSGKVKSLKASVGAFVRAGETLFEIEDTEYRLQYNQASASYNSAVASYNSTVGGTEKQSVTQARQTMVSAQTEYDSAQQAYAREKELAENNSQVVLAENALNDAKAARDRAYQLYNEDVSLISARNAAADAKNNYERTQSLFDLGAASQVALDTARISYENAQANVKAQESSAKAGLDSADTAVLQAEENLRTAQVNATAALDAADARLRTAETNLKSAKENYDLTVNVLNPERKTTAEASVKSAKAALDLAQNTLNNTVVKAPISGYVTVCNAVAGQNIQTGANAVTLINSNSMDIELNLTEAVVSAVQAGAEAVVKVPSAEIEDMQGTVASVAPMKDAQTGLFTVKINVPNEGQALKGGMFADVEIITERIDDVLAVPSDAILEQDEKQYVYVLEGETAVKTEVVTGKADEQYTEILSGLEEGARVVQTGKDFLKGDRCPVKVVG